MGLINNMSNSFFKFKQFTIQQDKCAMKVCTDSCILGAWFAQKRLDDSLILDIGSGTGLLMMMLAQKNNATIHGIEMDSSASNQSKENINETKWRNRLTTFCGDIRSHPFSGQYNFIITNPPFFENDLSSPSNEKNIAKHSHGLTLEELIITINKNLEPTGSFGILLPYHRTAYFENLALQNNFFVKGKLLIKQTSAHDYFRGIIHFSRCEENNISIQELIIKDENKNYTKEFTELMKDYYLYL
jgi:tRNA1Val (adenine37-N6)-methyltransferase